MNDIKNSLKLLVSGTKNMFKEFFNKETNKKQRANMWTFSRLIIPLITLIISLIAVVSNIGLLFLGAGLITCFGGLTDFFDGRSARKYNSTSEYGKLLDQISDKWFAGLTVISLCLINPLYSLLLVGELSIFIINLPYKLKYKDLDMKSSKLGKIKEWPLFFTLALGFLNPLSNFIQIITKFLITLTMTIQMATVMDYLNNNQKSVKTLKRKNIYKQYLNDEKVEEQEKIDQDINSKVISNSNSFTSRKKEYIKLRNLLNEIIIKKNNEENLEKTDNYQKIKTDQK